MDVGIANYYNELALRGLLQIVHFLTFYEFVDIEEGKKFAREIVEREVHINGKAKK